LLLTASNFRAGGDTLATGSREGDDGDSTSDRMTVVADVVVWVIGCDIVCTGIVVGCGIVVRAVGRAMEAATLVTCLSMLME
jgi:hypothetical protein